MRLLDLLSLTDFGGAALPPEALPPIPPFTVVGQGAVIAQPQGTGRRYGLDLVAAGSGQPLYGVFDPTVLTRALVWSGPSGSAVATPATSWAAAEDGQLWLDVLPTDLAGLEIQQYPLRIEAYQSGNWRPVWEGWLEAQPEPAGLAAALLVYCAYSDMTALGGKAIDQLRSYDEGAGFLVARTEARHAVDEVLLARYRPAGIGGPCWGAVWNGALGISTSIDTPNFWLKNQLDAGTLVVTSQVRRIAAARALGFLLGRQNDAGWVAKSARYHRFADNGLAGLVAQLDLNGDGYTDLSINCAVLSFRSY